MKQNYKEDSNYGNSNRKEVVHLPARIHGMTNTRLHHIWCSMRQRCNNPNSTKYRVYGGRGISICSDWEKSFTKFMKWAFGNGYSEGLTLDRIDVNGNYEPSNCRWISNMEQQSNKTNNHMITANGVTHTASQWSRITGLRSATILKRLRLGWTAEEAVSTATLPTGKNKSQMEA